MTTPHDGYWDELAIEWSAINPDLINVTAPRLKARLRRQSWLIMAALVTGLPLSAAGMLLGALTIWRGWTTGAWNFVTRGIAIGAISIILAIAVSLLVPLRASDAARAVSEMIDLSIARAQRTLLTIRLGLYAGAVAAASGLVGTVIRTYGRRPPQFSPVIDLVVLVIVALGFLVWGRHIRVNLERLRTLKRALDMSEEA